MPPTPFLIGVDLGTTYTAAAVWRDGRNDVVNLGNRAQAIPSVVLLRDDGTVLVGEAGTGKTTLIRATLDALPWIGRRCGRDALARALEVDEWPHEEGARVDIVDPWLDLHEIGISC
jgi:ABC-type microcin C transport system duplicated ATPase subunit YejF